jgi:hypothetical protein
LNAPSEPEIWNRFHISDSWLNIPTPAGPRNKAASLPRTRFAPIDTPDASDSDVKARAKVGGFASSLMSCA